ncbi:hypothetical protein LWI28_007192 [Acer negundo]|uniref:ABC transmembrane type-1 domain-containing protein n=1 Tax=Acer negundo TaxID=4023 RepID=A0AAD5P3Y3_ACENE|nr:hypothetical protein LWI28_007192 [Acer negundo]
MLLSNCEAIFASLSTDALAIKSLVGDVSVLIVQNIATMTVGPVIAFTANWMLALIILAISPMMLIDAFIQAKFQAGFSAETKEMYEEASQVANEAIGGMRTVASFCAEKKVMDLYSNETSSCYLSSYCHGSGHQQGNKAKVSAASILEILDNKPKIDSSNNEGTTLSSVDGDIEFECVSFKYPNRPNVPILKGLCLNIPSGKVEIHKLKLSWLRQQMGLVGQEPILFNETIHTNIAYGKQEQASEEEIITAKKAANAHNFIYALSQGYDTKTPT